VGSSGLREGIRAGVRTASQTQVNDCIRTTTLREHETRVLHLGSLILRHRAANENLKTANAVRSSHAQKIIELTAAPIT
jgi:hypothetical protein